MNPKKFVVILVLANVLSIGMAYAVKLFLLPSPQRESLELPPKVEVPPVELVTKPPAEPVIKAPEPPPIYVTGVLRKGPRIIVVMSDGTTRTEQDNTPKTAMDPYAGKVKLSYVTKNYVVYDNKRMYLTPRVEQAQKLAPVAPLKPPETVKEEKP